MYNITIKTLLVRQTRMFLWQCGNLYPYPIFFVVGSLIVFLNKIFWEAAKKFIFNGSAIKALTPPPLEL